MYLALLFYVQFETERSKNLHAESLTCGHDTSAMAGILGRRNWKLCTCESWRPGRANPNSSERRIEKRGGKMTGGHDYYSTKRLFELYFELTGIDLMASENPKKEVPKK